MPKKRQEAKGGFSASRGDMVKQKMGINSILKDVDFLGKVVLFITITQFVIIKYWTRIIYSCVAGLDNSVKHAKTLPVQLRAQEARIM